MVDLDDEINPVGGCAQTCSALVAHSCAGWVINTSERESAVAADICNITGTCRHPSSRRAIPSTQYFFIMVLYRSFQFTLSPRCNIFIVRVSYGGLLFFFFTFIPLCNIFVIVILYRGLLFYLFALV